MQVHFGPNAVLSAVSPYTLGVLRDIMRAAGLTSVTISSTARDSYNQARVMYENISTRGVEHQKALYGRFGDMVIDVFAANHKKGKLDVIDLMTKKIEELGPSNVSRHCADPSVLCVFDVAPSSIPRDKWVAFEKAVRADKRVSNFLTPPKDPGFHLEVPQPRK
jgi:hypothetical protein